MCLLLRQKAEFEPPLALNLFSQLWIWSHVCKCRKVRTWHQSLLMMLTRFRQQGQIEQDKTKSVIAVMIKCFDYFFDFFFLQERCLLWSSGTLESVSPEMSQQEGFLHSAVIHEVTPPPVSSASQSPGYCW